MTLRHRTWVITALVAMQVALVASLADRVFEPDFDPRVTIIGALVPWPVFAVLGSMRRAYRVFAYVAVVALMGSIVVKALDGNFPMDVIQAPIQGFAAILGVRWPAPVQPITVAAMTIFVGATTAVAMELASSRRSAAPSLLPAVSLLAAISLLSPKAGPPAPRLLVVFALFSLAILRLGVLSRSSAKSPLAVNVHDRRSIVTLAVVGLTAMSVGIVPALLAQRVSDADRFDPRDHRRGPSEPVDVVSPLARLSEWHSRIPDEVLFSTTAESSERWRLVALDRYDGLAWMPADDYRSAGGQIRVPEQTRDEPRSATVTLGSLDTLWLPAPQSVLSISADVRTDAAIGGLLAEESLIAGSSYDVVYDIEEPNTGDARGANAVRRSQTASANIDISEEIVELSEKVTAGAATDFDRATLIADYLKGGYILDPDSPSGHSSGLVELFLTETHRGRDEQFVAAFAALAAGAGLPVRIEVGFDLTPAASGGTQAMSSKTVAWPEIEFEGVGWVSFDAVPQEKPSFDAEGEQVVSPAPVDEGRAPPTTASSSPSTSAAEPPTEDEQTTTGKVVNPWWRVLWILLAVLAVTAAYLIGVLRIKSERRRRRSRLEQSDQRVAGAFRSGIDTLIDLGARAPVHQTDRELVHAGGTAIGGQVSELEPLAELATQAIFDERPPTMVVADEAWSQLDAFERQARSHVGWLRWTRSRFSARSLRRGLPEPQHPER